MGKRTPCPDCRDNPRPGQRDCLKCHAASMRRSRSKHDLTPEQRRRNNARSYLKVYLKRGKVTRQPCAVCKEPCTQPHHYDYSKPLEVLWLCRRHHLEVHRSGLRLTV